MGAERVLRDLGHRLRREGRAYLDQPAKRVALRARLMEPYRRARFHRFGEHSILHKPDWVYGPHRISIGRGVMILSGVWLSVERPGWERPGPVLEIGDRVVIRPYTTISAAESIVLEDDVMIGASSTVIDSDHTVDPAAVNIFGGPLRTSPIRIGRGTWIGDRTAILRGATIGEYCVIGTNSVVRGEIPARSIAVGAPARVVGSVGEPASRRGELDPA